MPITWDYIAGFFDGEGCVQLNAGRGSPVSVSIANTNQDVLLDIKRFLGFGHIYTLKLRPRRRQVWQFSVNNHLEVKRFLQGIVKPAIIKREAIQEALDYIQQKKWIHPMEEKDPAEVSRKYWQEGKRLADLASEYDCSMGAIRNFFRKNKIATRPGNIGHSLSWVQPSKVSEMLQGGHTVREISRELHCSPSAVYSFMRKNNITPRYTHPRKNIPPEAVRALYWQQGKTMCEIGKAYGVSSRTVYEVMRASGIPTAPGPNRLRKSL